jgi:5-methylcytosine-specific restriction protein A
MVVIKYIKKIFGHKYPKDEKVNVVKFGEYEKNGHTYYNLKLYGDNDVRFSKYRKDQLIKTKYGYRPTNTGLQYVNINFTAVTVYYHGRQTYRSEPWIGDHKITYKGVMNNNNAEEKVEELLKKEDNEYNFNELIKINNIKSISKQEVVAANTYNIIHQFMKGSHIDFAFINDVKFEENGMCVYTALAHLPNVPLIFKNKNKMLEKIQGYENIEANMSNREPRYLTLESGVSPYMIQKLCEEYNITHYCLDIKERRVLTHITTARNYQPICYISHDNHMYLITDKDMIKRISQSRSNDEANVMVKMCHNDEKEKRKIENDIYENVTLDKLKDYKNCTIIYSKLSLEEELFKLYEIEKKLYDQKSSNYKTTTIFYKNDVTLMVDPNYPLHLKIKKDSKDEITYKHVKEICLKYDIPFFNQSVSSVIREITVQTLNKNSERIKITKEQKNEILKKQNHNCNLCNMKLTKYQCDHIIPLSQNGTNELSNIQALCVQCHFEKTKEEQENGDYYALPDYASTFNKETEDIVLSKEFTRYSFIERFEDAPVKHKAFYIDINKTRRNILLYLAENEIRIPVFTCMDSVKPFNVIDTIKEGFYFVTSINYFPLRNNGWYSHAMINYCLDNSIITKTDIKYKLESSLSVKGDYFNDIIKELMTLPYGLDKAAPNIFIGLFNKLKHNINRSYYTHDFRQASTYFFDNQGNGDHNNIFIENKKVGNEEIFNVITSENITTDYFTNIIYHLILDIEALELHKLKTIIEQKGGHMTFLNTDCVECWFKKNKNPFRKIPNTDNIDGYFWDKDKKVPKYKFEVKDEPPTYQRMKQFKHTSTFYMQEKQWIEKPDPLHDNLNHELVNEILELESCNIDGIAGSGKTTLVRLILEQLKLNNKNVISLAPTNKACRNISKETMTIHKFLACFFTNKKALKTKIHNVDYIIIDEISMVKEIFYSIFLIIKKLKPTIRFIIAGDWRQLLPVKDRSNFDYENSQALFELCQGYRLLLTKCRRADKELFDLSLNVNDIDLSKIPKEEHETSICLTNDKRKERNFYWMNKKAPRNAMKTTKLDYDPNSQDMKIYKGLPIIARVNNKTYNIANNETFTVKFIDTKTKEVHIIDDKNEIKVPLNDFNKLFYPAYCFTTHKAQGTTINTPFTIYEWRKFNKQLKYTSITRGTELKNLNIIY